jgi:hypothetical protein
MRLENFSVGIPSLQLMNAHSLGIEFNSDRFPFLISI